MSSAEAGGSSPAKTTRERLLAQAFARERQRSVALEHQLAALQGEGGASPSLLSPVSVAALSAQVQLASQATAAVAGAGNLPPSAAELLSCAGGELRRAFELLTAAGEAGGSAADGTAAAAALLARLSIPRPMGASAPSAAAHAALLRENASLLSSLLLTRTAISVAVRVRPALEWERQRDAASARQYGGCPESVVDALSSHEVAAWDRQRKGWRAFAYDAVYGPSASQADVFQCAAPLAEAVLNGFNAACLAYGGTGSGKSHTMLGGPEADGAGLAPRLVRRVFELACARGLAAPNGRGPSGTLRVRVSVLEIYNDEIRDLLVDPAAPRLKLEVRTPATGAADGVSASVPTVISGLSSLDVEGAEEVEDILARALLARSVAATRMHENSSRSHAILRMDVAVTAAMDVVEAAWDWGAPSGTVARLYLADLAGSERVSKAGVSGDRLRETGHINGSLASLGDVMEALDKKATHVPFRNSKLTHVLSDSLGCSAKTLLIATVGTGAFTAEEAGQTLAFAARARKIDVGAAVRQLHYKSAVLAARSSEERTATAELTADAAKSAQVAIETAMARREVASAATIASLEATLSGLRAEVVSLRTRLDVEGRQLLLAREEAVASSLRRDAGDAEAGRAAAAAEIVAEAARGGTQGLLDAAHNSEARFTAVNGRGRPSTARARAHWSTVRSALYDVVLANQAGYDFWEGKLRDVLA